MTPERMEFAVAKRREARAALKKVRDIHSDEFKEYSTMYISAASNVIRVSMDGERIPAVDKNQFAQDTNTDLSTEIDDMFKILVARNCRQYRGKLIQKNISPEARLQAHCNIKSIIEKPLSAFYALGDMLALRLLDMLSTDRADFERKRVCSALIHVLMHISDCKRYLEEYAIAAAVAQLIRCIAPDDAEAHMRLGICIPFLPPSGYNLLPSFFHFCVFLDNRKVPIDHAEAAVAHRTVTTANEVIEDWTNGKEPPLLDLFSARFVSACWSVLTSEMESAQEAANSEKLWSELSQLLNSWPRSTPTPSASLGSNGTPPVGREALEEILLHAVGCAIFLRHRLSAKGGLGRLVCPGRAAAGDTLIRNLLMALCVDAARDLRELVGKVRKRRKNRMRHLQRKRKRGAEGASVAATTIFDGVVSAERVPVALGALSKLAHFWSKTVTSPDKAKAAEVAAALRALQEVVDGIEVLQRAAGVTAHCARVHSMTVAAATDAAMIPALPEDAHLCALHACRARRMLNRVALCHVPLQTLFSGESDGIVCRAVAGIGTGSYDTLVRKDAQRKVEEFGRDIVQRVDGAENGMGTEAAATLVALAIRGPRIARMAQQLNSFPAVRVANTEFALETKKGPVRKKARK